MRVTESLMRCPHCQAAQVEAMPMERCVILWDCPTCGQAVRPKLGDCCVFCSYGSVPCPSKQPG